MKLRDISSTLVGGFMHDHVFSDGIGSIALIGGTVRVDFMVYSSSEKEANGQPKAIHLIQVVMRTEGFLQAAEKMREAVQTISRLKSTADGTPPIDATGSNQPYSNSSSVGAATSGADIPGSMQRSKPPFP